MGNCTTAQERAKQAIDWDLHGPGIEPSKQSTRIWIFAQPGSEPSKRSTRTYNFLMANFWMKRWPSPWTPHANRGQVRAQGLDTLQRKTTTLTASKVLRQGVRSQMA